MCTKETEGIMDVLDSISEIQALSVLLRDSFYEMPEENFNDDRKVFSYYATMLLTG